MEISHNGLQLDQMYIMNFISILTEFLRFWRVVDKMWLHIY